MFPAHGAQTIISADTQTQLRCIIRKNLTAGGKIMTKRSVKVKENGLDHQVKAKVSQIKFEKKFTMNSHLIHQYATFRLWARRLYFQIEVPNSGRCVYSKHLQWPVKFLHRLRRRELSCED